MTTTVINRLETEFGTFRLFISFKQVGLPLSTQNIENLDMLGTDGWFHLDRNHANVIALLPKLVPVLVSYLDKIEQ